jgi:hypothetical protein
LVLLDLVVRAPLWVVVTVLLLWEVVQDPMSKLEPTLLRSAKECFWGLSQPTGFVVLAAELEWNIAVISLPVFLLVVGEILLTTVYNFIIGSHD